MVAIPVPMNYIALDENGVARVAGTGIKVRILAEELNTGYRPEDIQAAHDELSMAQVYAALAYYHANKVAFDQEIEAQEHMAAEYRSNATPILEREELLRRLQEQTGKSIQ